MTLAQSEICARKGLPRRLLDHPGRIGANVAKTPIVERKLIQIAGNFNTFLPFSPNKMRQRTMGKSPYHFRYHDDALRGYRKLTLEERGAYTTLLDLMYSEQDYLVENERILAAEMGVSTRKYRSLRDSLLRKGKIYYIDRGILSNRRFEHEMARRYERSVQAKLSGRTGGRKSGETRKLRKEINENMKQLRTSSIFQSNKTTDSEDSATSEGVKGRAEIHEHPSVVGYRRRLALKKW